MLSQLHAPAGNETSHHNFACMATLLLANLSSSSLWPNLVAAILCSSMLCSVLPSNARSAMISPMTLQNL